MDSQVDTLDASWVGWVAGVIDSRASLFIRESSASTPLPAVSLTVASDRSSLVRKLCELTGVEPVSLTKDYNRTSCSEHCPEQHTHVGGTYLRWSLTGARAVAVLEKCLPYLTVRREQAADVLARCDSSTAKAATVIKMRALGWAS